MIESRPAHDTAWAQALGIKEQVSTFTTRHNSGEERVKNIHRGADLLEQHDRRARRDVLAERHDRAAYGRTRLRRRAGVLRRVHRGRRRRCEPARDDGVQRGVLRRLRGRVPQAAHDLHLAVPDGSRSDRQLSDRRPEVPQQLEGRRLDPHFVFVDLDHRDVLRRQGRQGRHRGRPQGARRAPDRGAATSTARVRRVSTRTTCARTSPRARPVSPKPATAASTSSTTA